MVKILLLLLLVASDLMAQDRKIDPTWLHRYVPRLSEHVAAPESRSCRYKPIFGEGDAENRILRSVTRFGEVTVDARGSCQGALYDREEEIYLVLEGQGEMVAGSGVDGVEGRYPAKAGDAYYFRPNCTVGFYNQNKPGAKAYILAVRSRIPPPEDAD